MAAALYFSGCPATPVKPTRPSVTAGRKGANLDIITPRRPPRNMGDDCQVCCEDGPRRAHTAPEWVPEGTDSEPEQATNKSLSRALTLKELEDRVAEKRLTCGEDSERALSLKLLVQDKHAAVQDSKIDKSVPKLSMSCSLAQRRSIGTGAPRSMTA